VRRSCSRQCGDPACAIEAIPQTAHPRRRGLRPLIAGGSHSPSVLAWSGLESSAERKQRPIRELEVLLRPLRQRGLHGLQQQRRVRTFGSIFLTVPDDVTAVNSLPALRWRGGAAPIKVLGARLGGGYRHGRKAGTLSAWGLRAVPCSAQGARTRSRSGWA
jgi:hypothetical protein